MRVGVFTALLSQFPLDKVFEKLKALNISTVELGTGNYPGDPHCNLSMLDNEAELVEFKKKLDDHGFSISALSSHGNPLHPDPAIAKGFQEISKKTVLLAEKLGVPVVIDFSGCPGDCETAKFPNWVTCPWPPEYGDVLNWQWDKVVEPYWKQHGKFAADHGVKVAIGSVAHPMTAEHYIAWIEVFNGAWLNRKYLRPGEAPAAEFYVPYKRGLVVRAYCNLHGLWQTTVE